MTTAADRWTTEQLPGTAWDPEPPDGDDGSCRIPGLLPEQRDRVADVHPPEEYL